MQTTKQRASLATATSNECNKVVIDRWEEEKVPNGVRIFGPEKFEFNASIVHYLIEGWGFKWSKMYKWCVNEKRAEQTCQIRRFLVQMLAMVCTL